MGAVTDTFRPEIAFGVTLALQGGTPAGYRLLRAAAPGCEICRVPALGGHYDPAFLDGLFTFLAGAFGNGVNRPFRDEIPDDADANGISDAAGNLAGGCGCEVGSNATRGSAWALVGIGLLLARRRGKAR